jgi:HSP20 family protein
MLSLWGSTLVDVAPAQFRAKRDVHADARKVTIREDESSYTVEALVPGLKADEISLDVEGTTLHLRAERRVSVPDGFTIVRSERRPYRLNQTLRFRRQLQPESARATLRNGVLTVVLPFATTEQRRSVPINS